MFESLAKFVILSLVYTSLLNKAFAADRACRGAFQSGIAVTVNKQARVIDLFEEQEPGSSQGRMAHRSPKTTSEELNIMGKVLEIRLYDGRLGVTFEATNLQVKMDAWIRHRFELWEARIFSSNDALNFTSPERLLLIRRAKDKDSLQQVFRDEFWEAHKIEDNGSGMISLPKGYPLRADVRFELDSDGQLRGMNFGDLPNGLWGLEIRSIHNNQTETRFFIMPIHNPSYPP